MFRDITFKKYITPVVYIIVLLGIIVFTLFGDSGLYQLHKMYGTKNKLAHQIKENETLIKHLEAEKKRLNNPDYLEGIVRNELGYIKDGEIVYQISPEDNK